MKKSEVDTPVVTGDKDTDALLHTEQINQELPENQVALHSVGSVLDTEVAVVYPMNKDGSADYDSPFCLEDVDEEWHLELSEADHHIAHNTMLSFSCAPPQDITLLKRLLEDCYWTIRTYQRDCLETNASKRVIEDNDSLLRRLNTVTKVGARLSRVK
jgi:hypothetical protein